jgi:hypothetical protein
MPDESEGKGMTSMPQLNRSITIALLVFLWVLTIPGLVQAAPSAQNATGLTLDNLKNAEYRTQYTPTRTVTLTDGVYEDSDARLRIELTDFYALGDLNGDGLDDATAILMATAGSNAPFYELVALINNTDQTAIGGLILLGEGVKLNELAIVNGTIVVDYLRPQPGDAVCCPSRQVTQRYFSRRGLLTPQQTKSFGQIFPYQDGQLYGYVNALGEVVIEPQFTLASEFSEGMAAVSYDGRTTGYINQLGELVIEPRFSYGGNFVQGLALVGVPGVDAHAPFLSVYIDRAGRFVFGDQRFVSAEPFSEGLAAVSLDGEQYGYLDLMGNLVIEPQFSQAEAFGEGVAPAQIGDKYGYIDRAGKFTIDPQYESAEPFQNGLAQVVLGGKTGYINHSGQIVIEPVFDYGRDFIAGRALVAQEGKLVYIDQVGNVVIDIPNLTRAGDFAEGLAAVAVDDQFGYIDAQGNFVVPPGFSYAGNFENGLAVVHTSQSWGLINSIGELVLEIDRFAPVAVAKTGGAFASASGQPTVSTFAASSQAAAAAGIKTELIQYVPTLPDEVRTGTCSGNSELLALPGAWHCTVEGDAVDPCLVGDDGETLVCAPSPMEKYPGFRLLLEKPLPEANVTAQPPSELWQVRTDDDILCSVSRMGDMLIEEKRLTHVCQDGTALLGEIDRNGDLWIVEKATLVNSEEGEFTVENSGQVGIVTAWQVAEPK